MVRLSRVGIQKPSTTPVDVFRETRPPGSCASAPIPYTERASEALRGSTFEYRVVLYNRDPRHSSLDTSP